MKPQTCGPESLSVLIASAGGGMGEFQMSGRVVQGLVDAHSIGVGKQKDPGRGETGIGLPVAHAKETSQCISHIGCALQTG